MTTQVQNAMTVRIGRGSWPVADYATASQVFCAARDKSGRGASATPIPEIVDHTGSVVAHISYNGKVWPGAAGSWQPEMSPIFNPYN